MATNHVRIARYDEDLLFTTPRDSLSDLVDHLRFCTSTAFTSELLQSRHAMAQAHAKPRAKRIGAHMRTALEFIDQALSSRPEVAAVACYYATLNLAKCYLLASPRCSALEGRLLHGLSCPPSAKDSHKLPKEVVQIHPKGVFPTLYEVITGQQLSEQTIRMGDVYPFIADTGVEWRIARRQPLSIAYIGFEVRETRQGGRFAYVSAKARAGTRFTAKALQLLRNFKFRRVRGSASDFRGPVGSKSDDVTTLLRTQLHRFLLYDSNLTQRDEKLAATPLSNGGLLLPQELPLILAFYHLSSVQRYNPEFMAKLKDSVYWPLVLSLQWHGLQKFALLTWSFLQQKNVIVNAR